PGTPRVNAIAATSSGPRPACPSSAPWVKVIGICTVAPGEPLTIGAVIAAQPLPSQAAVGVPGVGHGCAGATCAAANHPAAAITAIAQRSFIPEPPRR